MITTVLSGGLGNQMFQIAVAYAVARDNDDEYAFDFNNKMINQGNSGITYRGNYYSMLKELPIGWKPAKVFKQPQFDYKSIPYHKDMQLVGHFQSEKFFGGHKNDIIELFMNKEVENGMKWLLKERYAIELRNSIGLHVRRGDYLRFPDHHPIVSDDYYTKAIEYIRERKEIDCILVFSDDIQWCKKEFIGNPIRYAEGLNDAESMCLMSLCSHNILANSSFSWWASYFNENKDKITCAPKKWFGPKARDHWEDIYREEMVII